MGWMQMLYETYNNNTGVIGKTIEGKESLSLIAHMLATAQITITIDEEGAFRGATTVEKAEGKTIIPVTEASAGRASGSAPHPLCDTLSYVAGDFALYQEDSKIIAKSNKKFSDYITALEAWEQSEYKHPKTSAILNYIRKADMVSDLIKAGILECNDAGKLAEKKVAGNTYEKALVRFRVLSRETDQSNAVWEDQTLRECYVDYYLATQNGKKDMCYVKGEIATISINHPKGIVSSNYGAKLISANDKTGFTFRGRFNTSQEAFAVSYGVTQKAHNALTWLIKNQGVMVGNKDKRTYLCWNPKGKKVPNIENPFNLVDDNPEDMAHSEEEYKKQLISTFNGFSNKLDDCDNILIMGFDAATTGRLSITYYSELRASDFLFRLKEWGETCCWYFNIGLKENIQTPLTKQIVRFAFGAEQGTFVEVSDQVMKEQSQRILHCMIDRQPVPKDIIHALFQKASTPLAYAGKNRKDILSVACALIQKHYNDKKEGVKIKMKLDYENDDRSYLFGRLLAVAEKIERSTFAKEEKREPNAIRLQSAYVNHPMQTWNTLETALIPYYQKLRPGSRMFYKNLVSTIIEMLKEEDTSILNKSLEDMYLIGYYLQRAELNKQNQIKESEQEEE